MNRELETVVEALSELIEAGIDGLDAALVDLCQEYVQLYENAVADVRA